MKRIIVLLVFVIVAVASVSAQQAFNVAVSDSVKTGDTTYTYVIDHADLKKGSFYYSSHVDMDSISGTQAAYVYLQFSNQASGDYWYNADTVSCVTPAGASASDFTTGTLSAVRVRLYVVTSGTTTTYFRWGFHAVPRK